MVKIYLDGQRTQASKKEILEIESDGTPVGKVDPRNARLDVIEKAKDIRNKLQTRGI
jgi:para-nitrobenzyl esterase